MKTLNLVLILFLTIFSSFKKDVKADPEPTVTKFVYYYQTLNDNKDWNTQLGVDVYLEGRVIAEQFCCSSGHPNGADHGTTFDDNKPTTPTDLKVNEKITKSQLDHATYAVSIKAVGNDRWIFDIHLKAIFSDGTYREWSFFNNTLNSTNSNRVFTPSFNLGDPGHYKDK